MLSADCSVCQGRKASENAYYMKCADAGTFSRFLAAGALWNARSQSLL